MEQEVIPGSLLKRGIKLKLPDVLPRAMADNARLLEAMNALHATEVPAELKAAVNQGPDASAATPRTSCATSKRRQPKRAGT
jgi:hypothetical protein